MLKFYFPKSTEQLNTLFTPTTIKKELIMVAECDKEIEAGIAFLYKGDCVNISAIHTINASIGIDVLDGLFRCLMFHLMEMECRRVQIHECPEMMKEYLTGLNFSFDGTCWHHDDFPSVMFNGCPSCGGCHD